MVMFLQLLSLCIIILDSQTSMVREDLVRSQKSNMAHSLSIYHDEKGIQACKLVHEAVNDYVHKQDTLIRLMDDAYFYEFIVDTLIQEHIVVLYTYALRMPPLTYTCIVNKEKKVSLLFLDYEGGFNQCMTEEGIRVNSYDMAVNVAKIFVRMMIPMISIERQFFADEILYESFDDYYRNVGRSEFYRIYEDTSFNCVKYLHMEYKKKFQKKIIKRDWITKVEHHDSCYIVYLLTVGGIETGIRCEYRLKILKWKIKVFPNGTIDAVLPKGIRILYDRDE